MNQSLARSRYEILVVNNGGSEHTRTFIQPILDRIDPSIRLLQPPKNLGYAGGCGYGVTHAESDHFILQNDDAIADPACLALILTEFRRRADLGVVVGRIVDATGPRVQHEGVTQTLPNALFWQTGWGEPDGPARPRPNALFSRDLELGSIPAPASRYRDLDFFSGCVWGTSRQVWDEVGGLGDLYHPGYYEDTEYGLRCRQLGYRIRLLTGVTCSHFGSLTLGTTSNAYWRAFHRSRYLYLLRNRTGFDWCEILLSEWKWWRDYHADSHASACLLGFLTALPRFPKALSDRYRFRKKCRIRL